MTHTKVEKFCRFGCNRCDKWVSTDAYYAMRPTGIPRTTIFYGMYEICPHCKTKIDAYVHIKVTRTVHL